MNALVPGLLATIAGVITVGAAAVEVYDMWRKRAARRGETPSAEEATSPAGSHSQLWKSASPARLRTSALGTRYGAFQALYDVTIAVDAGEVVALVGPRGAGKSTVLRALMGLIPTDSGDIVLNDASLLKNPVRDRVRLGLTYLPQELSVFSQLTVEENIRTVLKLQSKGVPLTEAAVRTRLETLLELFELTALRARAAVDLSGSQQRRVELARALATNPRFLLLDEPFSRTGASGALVVQSIINYAREHGIGILIAEQDAKRALIVSDRAYIMTNGRIVAEGKTEEFVAVPKAPEGDAGLTSPSSRDGLAALHTLTGRES